MLKEVVRLAGSTGELDLGLVGSAINIFSFLNGSRTAQTQLIQSSFTRPNCRLLVHEFITSLRKLLRVRWYHLWSQGDWLYLVKRSGLWLLCN